MKAVWIFLLFAAAALSQTAVYYPPISDQLKSYLQLDGSQIEKITAINLDYARFVGDRSQRQVQLLTEIGAETAKSTVDPMALGVRYTEMESLRREVKDETTKVRTRVVALLSDSQKALLSVLDQAMRLQAQIYDAQCQNILQPAPPMVLSYGDNGGSTSTSTGTSGGGFVSTGACGTGWISTSTFIGPAQSLKNIQK